MKTKENKIKITLKTIIYSVFAFFTILYIVTVQPKMQLLLLAE